MGDDFEADSCDNWFEVKSEDAINPMRATSADQITEGLKYAITNWEEMMKKFGFLSSNTKKRRQDWKPTVAKGPRLSTEKRFGKREEKLKEKFSKKKGIEETFLKMLLNKDFYVSSC